MTRQELEQIIRAEYSTEPEYPWARYPDFAVFRHSGNAKWFAVTMAISGNKLGLTGTEPVDIVNFKCSPLMIGSLLLEPGFFPAYHMNKDTWISAALDGTAPEETIRMLLDRSYDDTNRKGKQPKKAP